MDLGRTALRFVIGPLFVGHGTQKLFGWFGGHGPDGTGAFFEHARPQAGQAPGDRRRRRRRPSAARCSRSARSRPSPPG